MVELRFLWWREHQADAAAIEESHFWNREEALHSEGITIERSGAFEFVNVDRDLPDLIQRWVHIDLYCIAVGSRARGLTSRSAVKSAPR